MCHSRTNERKIDSLHERCLGIIYNDKQSSFKELLEKDSSVLFMQKLYKFWLLKKWKPENCPCRVRTKNIPNVAFTQKHRKQCLNYFC